MSMVRSNSEQKIGFVCDEKRMNVSLTRARHFLLMIGNRKTLETNELWNSYISEIEKLNSYYTVINSNENFIKILIDDFFKQNKRKSVRCGIIIE